MVQIDAQNLMLFLQIADGVDDATWLFHLRQGDFTRWLADASERDYTQPS